LSMMALRATAEGGDRFAVVIDKVPGVKHAPPCETMDHPRPIDSLSSPKWILSRKCLCDRKAHLHAKLKIFAAAILG
jgi:hypothetical protein